MFVNYWFGHRIVDMRLKKYRPPQIKQFDSLERGRLVLCPAERGGYKPRSGDPLVPRSSCMLKKEAVCEMCPNSKFEMIFEDIGPPESYQWLDSIMEKTCKIIDGKIVTKQRGWGDCCIDHKGCIMLKYEIHYDGVIDESSAKAIYDAAKTSSEQIGAYEILHFKVTRWDHGMRITIALR